MAVKITSAENAQVKLAASLHRAKMIRAEQLYLAEGAHLAAEALRSGVTIERAFVEEGCSAEVEVLFAELERRDVPCALLPRRLVEKISEAKTPQGIVLLVRLPEEQLKLHTDGRYLLLENLQDPGNVGNILRSAESFDFDGVLLCGETAEVYTPKAVRGSMGSVFRLPTARYADGAAAACALRGAGIPLFTAELRGDSRLPDELPERGLCIAIGNEGRGITEELSALADASVEIPMSGKTESLSAPVAAAVLMWELFRRRR